MLINAGGFGTWFHRARSKVQATVMGEVALWEKLRWGTSGPQGDLNSDGIVDTADVGAVYNDWYGGDTPPFVHPRTASQAINAPDYYITSGVNQQAGLGDTDGYVITRQVVTDSRSGALANNGIVLSILSDDEIVIFSKEYAPASPLQALKPVLIIKTN